MSSELKPIKSALISVYHKTGLSELATHLSNSGVRILATGGTFDHIKKMGLEVTAVDEITDYPSILGGRVKTLHPKVFGGILNRRDNEADRDDCEKYSIPSIDLVVVDLYPFSDTLQAGGSESEIIEKIDIGGVSLLRAAAKNFRFVTVVSSFKQYQGLMNHMDSNKGCTDLEFRRVLAANAFETTASYDRMIGYWTLTGERDPITYPSGKGKVLRYGENPHQQGIYFGDLDDVFVQLSGKELSYNNLLDIDAAISLAGEFSEPMAAVVKHNNACGVACGPDAYANWVNALESDPVSAFGGIIVLTSTVDERLASEIGKLFFEVLLAPDFTPQALQLLMAKKNRIILKISKINNQSGLLRSVLNGLLWQSADSVKETASDLRVVTNQKPDEAQVSDLLFANRIVKHSRSNTIVLAKNNRLIAAGVGQTSRVDALNQAIDKAHRFGLSLDGAVMASDAFFPFPDCVDIADKAGIKAVIQPGGSLKDQDSIDRCNASGISMVFTGIRHFKH
ncbi:MAG: bifunctional phosphoribosylaminoimidazolecarboxamide formyltransferase/IMP cyclohydrolase [Bacteroidota bacterium]